MVKKEKITAKVLKKVVEKSLVADANSTSCVFVYQPKAPAKLDKFKKNKV